MKPFKKTAYTAGAALLLCAVTVSVSGASSAVAAPGNLGTSSTLVAEMLDSVVTATGAEMTEGQEFSLAENQLEGVAEAKCMAGHGWSVSVPKFSGGQIQLAATTFFVSNALLPNLAWISKHGLFEPAHPASGFGWDPSGRESRAEEADFGKCQTMAQQPMAAFDRAERPLSLDWWGGYGILMRVQAEPEMVAAGHRFSSCVERAGVPPKAARIGRFLNGWVATAEKHSKTHARLLANERHWVKVFVPCATPLVSLEDRLLTRTQHAFEQSHYEEIQVLENLVTKDMAALARLADVPASALGGK
jgi:hypothetical protein